jgi:hypothetical protein
LISVRATPVPTLENNLYPIDYIDLISILAWVRCFKKTLQPAMVFWGLKIYTLI